jgi:3-oxoacyl-[acyl-carrier-protein] synthase III
VDSALGASALLQQENLFTLGPEVVRFREAEIAIAYGAWGRPIDNETLFALSGVESEVERKTIEATGITQRHHLYPHPERNPGDAPVPPNEAANQVELGAYLTRQALRANGWDGADLLIATSSILPKAHFAEAIAEAAALSGAQVKHYFLACNGAVGALFDLLHDASMRDSRVVITAVEGLSVGVKYSTPATAAIFGNGAASMAFRPREFTLVTGKTVIVPDTQGVIRVPHTYELPPLEERQARPAWYELAEGAEAMFACGPHGAMTTLPASHDPFHCEMEGLTTARFFARVVPPVVRAVLETCRQEHVELPDPLLGVFHQPSAGVLGLVNRSLEKSLAAAGLPALNVPWVLDEVGVGNVSSATTLIVLAHLERKGQIPRGIPFMLTGFGIGASITSMVIRI